MAYRKVRLNSQLFPVEDYKRQRLVDIFRANNCILTDEQACILWEAPSVRHLCFRRDEDDNLLPESDPQLWEEFKKRHFDFAPGKYYDNETYWFDDD